jgi:hypothetical protein
MIICIGPSDQDLEQTASSLYFGQRAMKIENRPVINKKIDFFSLNKKFLMELESKEEEIEYLESQREQMMEKITQLENDNEDL